MQSASLVQLEPARLASTEASCEVPESRMTAGTCAGLGRVERHVPRSLRWIESVLTSKKIPIDGCGIQTGKELAGRASRSRAPSRSRVPSRSSPAPTRGGNWHVAARSTRSGARTSSWLRCLCSAGVSLRSATQYQPPDRQGSCGSCVEAHGCTNSKFLRRNPRRGFGDLRNGSQVFHPMRGSTWHNRVAHFAKAWDYALPSIHA